MRDTRFTKATVVVAVGLLAAACGDSTPSHDAFTEKVQSICSASSARHEKVAPDFDFASFNPDTSDLTTVVPVIEGHAAIGEETVAQLARLRGPKADVAKLDEHLALARQIHELAAKEIAAAKAGDREVFKRLIAQDDELESQLAEDDTFASC